MVHKMSDDDAWAFLREGSRTATFASVRPNGLPHATPTWYAVDDPTKVHGQANVAG
jgi:hypothetical protein